MKRSRFSRRAKQTPATEQLIHLAGQLSQSGSRLEDSFWEAQLGELVYRLLADNDETTLNAALDNLFGVGGRPYDELADMVESCSEIHRSDSHDVLLFAAPVLAWSRYAIPAGPIAAEHLAAARAQLHGHVLARDARLSLADFLFSPDQLPQSYCETAQLTEKLAKGAQQDRDIKLEVQKMPETVLFLSDTRYLIGAVAAPRGLPMFRWQENDGSRAESLKQWRSQGGEVLRPLLTACAVDLLLPQAYHAAAREADRASRPYSLRAGVAFLQTTLNISAHEIRAIIAPYYDRELEEYRIGLTRTDSSDVIHGVVWPILDNEDDSADTTAHIDGVLKEAGVRDVLILDHRFPLEYCDDCGTPLYPNPDGEPTHAELPDDQTEAAPRHLH